jgi:hypothetical protein
LTAIQIRMHIVKSNTDRILILKIPVVLSVTKLSDIVKKIRQKTHTKTVYRI